MEHKIGECITLEDGRVVEVVIESNCDLCALADSDMPCDPHWCSGTLRKDHKNIVYKEVKEDVQRAMGTIEEREVAFGKREIRHSNGILWEAGYREGSKVGYHFGATEQQAIDIDKAWKFIEVTIIREGHASEDFVEEMNWRFKKAMEE